MVVLIGSWDNQKSINESNVKDNISKEDSTIMKTTSDRSISSCNLCYTDLLDFDLSW